MPVVYGEGSNLVSLQWETTNTRSGAAATVLGFEGGTDSSAAATGVATLVGQAWVDHMAEITDTSWQLGTVRCETASFSVEVPIDEAGTENLNGPPSNVTILDSKSGSRKGPRNRGRNYWPALVAEASVDERGALDGARQTVINAQLADFYAQIGATSLILAIPQSDVPGQASEPQVPWPSVVARGVQGFIATQRRRVR